MFVVTARDLQSKQKEIRAKVLAGEDALVHGVKGEDMILISQKRYNELIKIEQEKMKRILAWYDKVQESTEK